MHLVEWIYVHKAWEYKSKKKYKIYKSNIKIGFKSWTIAFDTLNKTRIPNIYYIEKICF